MYDCNICNFGARNISLNKSGLRRLAIESPSSGYWHNGILVPSVPWLVRRKVFSADCSDQARRINTLNLARGRTTSTGGVTRGSLDILLCVLPQQEGKMVSRWVPDDSHLTVPMSIFFGQKTSDQFTECEGQKMSHFLLITHLSVPDTLIRIVLLILQDKYRCMYIFSCCDDMYFYSRCRQIWTSSCWLQEDLWDVRGAGWASSSNSHRFGLIV